MNNKSASKWNSQSARDHRQREFFLKGELLPTSRVAANKTRYNTFSLFRASALDTPSLGSADVNDVPNQEGINLQVEEQMRDEPLELTSSGCLFQLISCAEKLPAWGSKQPSNVCARYNERHRQQRRVTLSGEEEGWTWLVGRDRKIKCGETIFIFVYLDNNSFLFSSSRSAGDVLPHYAAECYVLPVRGFFNPETPENQWL